MNFAIWVHFQNSDVSILRNDHEANSFAGLATCTKIVKYSWVYIGLDNGFLSDDTT